MNADGAMLVKPYNQLNSLVRVFFSGHAMPQPESLQLLNSDWFTENTSSTTFLEMGNFFLEYIPGDSNN